MEEKNYWNPIFSGFLLGTVLFIAYAIAGQGIGASGAFARATAQLSYLVDPGFASNAYAGKYLKHGNALSNWIVVELVGVMIGGFISALFSGRVKQSTDRGVGYPVGKRLFFAFLGGVLVAFATRLARGCTSGQALSGAGGFSVGAWIFMLSAFGAGMLLAPLFRKQWKGL